MIKEKQKQFSGLREKKKKKKKSTHTKHQTRDTQIGKGGFNNIKRHTRINKRSHWMVKKPTKTKNQ